MKRLTQRATPRLQRLQRLRQAGAALLAAMLTVVLVATFAASAMWQQWRSIEVEAAERARIQAAWILIGALDWSRLILREDARANSRGDGTDNLTEPWSVPLEEARLSTFLAAQRNVSQVEDASTDTNNAFLSGRITDMQSRMNLRNLAGNSAIDDKALAQFTRLFNYLGLSVDELKLIAQNMLAAQTTSTERNANIPLMPKSLSQLTWWGVQPATLVKLAPFVTLLPIKGSTVNLNTAPAEVIWASAIGLDMSDAQRLVQSRQAHYFANVEAASKLLSNPALITTTTFAVASDYFEVRGRLRIEQTIVEERSLVFKQSSQTTTLWRERGGFIRDSADALATTPQK